MIPFAAYTAMHTQTLIVLQWAEQPPKLPIPASGSRPSSNMVPRDHTNQRFRRHMDRFIQFCTELQCDQHTDRHTDHVA